MPIRIDDGSDIVGSINPYWWNAKGLAHKAVWPVVNQLRKEQASRNAANRRHRRLYGNIESAGRQEFGVSQNYGQVTYNLCKSAVETVLSTIYTQKTRVSILTEGGDWQARRRGKQLEKAVGGLFYLSKTYEETRRVAFDALTSDTGFLKICRDNIDRKKINAERTLPDEILVDSQDSIYGKPRSLHHVQLIAREVLLAWYDQDKKTKDAIKNCERADVDRNAINGALSDQVWVAESWHLPSSEDAGDGKHTITISNADLVSEEYKRNYFPFVPLRWTDRPMGYYGCGIIADLEGVQFEINNVLAKMQDAVRDNVVRIGIEEGSNVVESHLNDVPMTIVTYHTNPPVPLVFNSFPPELRSYLQDLITRGFEIAGISQMTANSTKPAGLNSAVAQREFKDTQSQRFLMAGQRLEEFYVEAADHMIDLAKEIDEDTEGGLKIQCTAGKFVERIDWSDVDMKRDAYIMRAYPTAFLPSTPAGKLEAVSEMMQNELITREEGMMLLDYPDLENVTSLINAQIRHIDLLIEKMLDLDEDYEQPNPFDNLEMAIKRISQAILKAEIDGYPEDRIDKLRQYVTDAHELLEPPQDMAANPPGPPATDSSVSTPGLPPPTPEALSQAQQVMPV